MPWSVTFVTLDGVDPVLNASYAWEAIKFIEDRTRLQFDVQFVPSSSRYNYQPVANCGVNPNWPPDNTCYWLAAWGLPSSVLDPLRASSSYYFLHKMNGLRPLNAGSTIGVSYGVAKEGRLRPWSSSPTDMWWWNSEPFEGFSTRAAQIMAHEMINTIQAKIEVAPYNCAPLTATPGLPAAQYEGDRLSKLEPCYPVLGNNDGGR